MTGRIIYTPQPPHVCETPVIEWVNRELLGAVWQCDDCAKTWVFVDNIERYGRGWRREINWERRRRERRQKKNDK